MLSYGDIQSHVLLVWDANLALTKLLVLLIYFWWGQGSAVDRLAWRLLFACVATWLESWSVDAAADLI